MKEEYNGLTEEEVRQIYIEETGKQPPETIDIYNSEKYIDKIESNGFNGTIIHFYDEEAGINQMYTITRGSELTEQGDWRPEDWAYNLMGIFIGQNAKQYEAAVDFDEVVTDEIKDKYCREELTKIGLGHSLGANLITLMQLTDQMYDNVYTTNAAPPTTYQLANVDRRLLQELSSEYNIDFVRNFNAIYDLNPSELEAFAERYYKDQGKNINNLGMDQDFLHALSVVRGFIEVGDYKNMDAYSGQNIESLDGLFAQLPDDLIKEIQIFFSENYSEIYNNEGFDGFLQALTGINPKLIDLYAGTVDGDYSWTEVGKDIIKSVKDASARIPETLSLLNSLRQQIGPIINAFVTAGLIDEENANLILAELKVLEKDLKTMRTSLTGSGIHLLPGNPLSRMHASLIKQHLAKVKGRIENLGKYTEDIIGLIMKNVDAHSLEAVIKAQAAGSGKAYESGDVYVRAGID